MAARKGQKRKASSRQEGKDPAGPAPASSGILRRILVYGCLLILVLVLAYGVRTIMRSIPPEKNLLVITLDTVRADRLGCYGYPGRTTPNLDAMAAGGVLFENAIATVPLTLPSHTTLMTGLYPTSHGIRDNTSYRLSGQATTLAEILSDHGYRTGAVIGAFVLDSTYGLDQGFEFYDDDLPAPTTSFTNVFETTGDNPIRMKEISERSASLVTRRAVSWLRHASGEQFFLWVHYYDPHYPYTPPPGFAAQYLDRPYEGEIAFVDKNVGTLVDELRSRDLLENTMIVVAGDHGEGLGEHGEETHAIFIYESTVRVPLIIRYPERAPAGRRVGSVVSLVDVVPTVLDLLEIDQDVVTDGRSLRKLIEGEEADDRALYTETLFPYLNYGWSKVRGIRTDEWKYIQAPRPELYRISDDPHEENNLINEEPETARSLSERLTSMTESQTHEEGSLAEDAALSPTDRERLASLGYLSGAPPDPEHVSLADPKDMIDYHEMINQGEHAMDRGDFEKALELFTKVVRADSTNALAQNLIGMVSYQKGDTASARRHFQRAVELNPGLSDAFHNLGNIYFHQEDYDRAAEFYEKAIELSPGAGEYYIALGQIYARMGDNRKARSAYQEAIDMGFASPELFLANGIVLSRLGRYQEARESIEQALSLDPGSRDAYNEYGNLLDGMGSLTEAATKYRQAIGIDPGFAKAHFNLARVLLKLDREEEALQELYATTEADPNHAGAHYLLGQIYYQRGNAARAKEHLKRFLELEKQNEPARDQVRNQLMELG